MLHGAFYIRSGDLALLVTEDWTQRRSGVPPDDSCPLAWLEPVVFEDRASQHKAARVWTRKA